MVFGLYVLRCSRQENLFEEIGVVADLDYSFIICRIDPVFLFDREAGANLSSHTDTTIPSIFIFLGSSYLKLL